MTELPHGMRQVRVGQLPSPALACGMGVNLFRVCVQTGGVGSKYDDYWAGQLPQIRALVEAAASGGRAAMRVPDLTRLGTRQSWHGTADVLGQETAGSSGAHATSLGKTAAASGICQPWPGLAFRSSVSAAGDMLTITATADHRRPESGPASGPSSQPRPAPPDGRRQPGPARPGHLPRAAAASQMPASSTGSWIS